MFTQLPSVAVLVPAVAPASTLNELQELLDDALVAEGYVYARSDDSLSLTDDDDADVPAEELVDVIYADGFSPVPLRGADDATVAEVAEAPDLAAAMPDSSASLLAPTLRRSTRGIKPVVRLTHPRPQSRAFRRLVRRHVHQAQINSLVRAELERRSTTAAAALPPDGVFGSVAAVDAASGLHTASPLPTSTATGCREWEPAHGMAGVIVGGRDMWKHRVWHKRDCKIVEG